MNLFAHSRKHINSAPHYMVFAWFGGSVLLGTILLWLPVSHASDEIRLSFVAALFTAVSAACVTGLSVVNVANTFSFSGQLVIFLLMETGGIGIMTFATVGFRLLGRRLSLAQQVAATEALYQNDAAVEFRETFWRIFKVTLAIQVIGAVWMAFTLAPWHWRPEEADGFAFLAWSAAFHSVSAFCNAGFSIYPDALDSLAGNTPFLSAILVLAVLGGLGHIVLHELYRLPHCVRHGVKKPHWLSLHTRVVLSVTAILMAAGVLSVRLFGTAPGDASLRQAVFMSVSGRTAGFSITSMSALPLPTVLIMTLLMFIGGSPGSCAGGIKTTSIAIWFARIRANLRNDSSVNLFGYAIAPELVSRARILMALAALWTVGGVFILAGLHPDEDLKTLLFEQVSAFGTAGLSLDFTPRLSPAAQLWVSISMFVGRLGPLGMALWIMPATKTQIGRPAGRIMVG